MSPQLFQSIKLMELPIMDLKEKIGEELEKNPALEVLEEPGMLSLDAAEAPPREDDDYFEASSDSGFVHRGGMDGDQQRQFLEGVISRPETLQEHLLWQLALETADHEVRRIGELLIQNLDDDGFHKEPPESFFKGENPGKIKEALELVRSLDPPGTCTTGYKESLRVQVRLLPDAPAVMAEALDYLEDLERGNFSRISPILGCTEEHLRLCYNRIQEDLSPFPGRQFNSGGTRYAVPDVEVRQQNGKFSIFLNKEEIPVLGINPFFMKLSGNRKRSGKAARDFARENIREARWFIQSINQRNHTLLRVASAIVGFQHPFFIRGPKYLAPLTLRDIAGELGIHETTVSRTANNKYIQTEWGLYELRHFFSNSITGTGSQGSRFSKEGVKQILKEIISNEKRNLSDQELTEILAQREIPLARRTVTKYRNELDLGSSYTR
jgi:RNA polymerase sigma-54 factor